MTYFVLIVAAACIVWTVTKEEIFRPLRVWLDGVQAGEEMLRDEVWLSRSRTLLSHATQKLAYLPTCDYCFGHWVMLVLYLAVSPAPLVAAGVVGHVITYFVLVAGTAVLTTLFSVVRQVNKLITGVALWRERRSEEELGMHEVSSGYRRGA